MKSTCAIVLAAGLVAFAVAAWVVVQVLDIFKQLIQ